MNQFNQVFESKLRKLSDMMSILPKNEYSPSKGEIFFNIDIFSLEENPTVKIITGVKNNPQGISLTNSDYYMFVTPNERFICSVSDLKGYIRNNFKHLKPCVCSEFKYAGYEVPYTDIKMLSYVVSNEIPLLQIAA